MRNPAKSAQREDRLQTARSVLFDELLKYKALLLGEFGRSHRHHGRAFHQAHWIAAKMALIYRLLAEPTQR